MTKKNTAALLLGHGSRAKEANDNMMKVAGLIAGKGVFATVEVAFLELCPPSIPEGIRACVDKGAEHIIAVPYFLHSGVHVKRDLPIALQEEAKNYPGIRITFGGNIGFHPVLADIMLERLLEAAQGVDIRDMKIQSEKEIVRDLDEGQKEKAGFTPVRGPARAAPLKPEEIEPESFRIILEELGEHSFNSFQLPIVQRIIHASGDFDFGRLIHFHPRFFHAAVQALSTGRALLADVNMVAAGANRRLLEKFGIDLHCFIAEEEIMERSRREGKTRAAMAMRKGASLSNLGGVVVGNAPTALREILRLHREAGFNPGFVIAAPVGFVDAEESKEALIKEDIPCVAIRGRKGGSPIAAAILNAVLMLYDAFGERLVEGDAK